MNLPVPQRTSTKCEECHVFSSGGSKGGGREGRAPPRGPKFFRFHAVFGKIWQNRMLAPPLGSWRPLLGEILDPPLYCHYVFKSAINWYQGDYGYGQGSCHPCGFDSLHAMEMLLYQYSYYLNNQYLCKVYLLWEYGGPEI